MTKLQGLELGRRCLRSIRTQADVSGRCSHAQAANVSALAGVGSTHARHKRRPCARHTSLHAAQQKQQQHNPQVRLLLPPGTAPVCPGQAEMVSCGCLQTALVLGYIVRRISLFIDMWCDGTAVECGGSLALLRGCCISCGSCNMTAVPGPSLLFPRGSSLSVQTLMRALHRHLIPQNVEGLPICNR